MSFAWLSQAQGDPAGALATLDEAEELVQRRADRRVRSPLVLPSAACSLSVQKHDEEAESWAREYVSRMDEHPPEVKPDLVSQMEFLYLVPSADQSGPT